MYKRGALLLFLSLTSCGVESLNSKTDFLPYIASFQIEAASRGIATHVNSLIVRYGENMKSTTAATCTYGDGGLIEVNPRVWSDLSDITREILLFHELGHCILYKDHDDSQLGIMNKILLPGYIGKSRAEYLEDFFYH